MQHVWQQVRSTGRRWWVVFAVVAVALTTLPAAAASALGAGTYVYVSNAADDTLAVLNAATGTKAAAIPVGDDPGLVALSTDGRRAYVANGSGSVTVIDTAQESVVTTIDLTANGPSTPYAVALSPDGTRLYVTDLAFNPARQGRLFVIDTTTNLLAASVTVGDGPGFVVASATQIFTSDNNADTVTIIDAATNTVTATVPVGHAPFGLALSKDGSRLFVANQGGPMSEIDVATATVVPAPAINRASQLALSLDGSRLYVTNETSAVVDVVDTATNVVLTSFDAGVGVGTLYVSVGPDGRIIVGYSGNAQGYQVRTFDPATYALLSSTSQPGNLQFIAVGTIAPTGTKADVRTTISGPASGTRNTGYSYTVTVKNLGPAASNQVVATAILPPGGSLVSASGSYSRLGPLLIWKTVPTLASNASTTYTVTVKFAYKGTQLVTGAAGSLKTPDPVLSNNVAAAATTIR